MVVFVVLAVGVEIDETGCDQNPADVHYVASFERRRRDGFNAFAANSDVTDGVEAGFGIHHAAVGEHGVVGLAEEQKRK